MTERQKLIQEAEELGLTFAKNAKTATIEKAVNQAKEDKLTEIKKGDFVTFPKGMKCTWTIHEGIKKHYSFG